MQAMSLHTANAVISFLNSCRFRSIDNDTIKKTLVANKNNVLFKTLLTKIFTSQFPTFPTLSMSEMADKPYNPLFWFSIDANLSLEKDREANSRFFEVLKYAKDFHLVFYNKVISCEEAYFYLDLFRGSKFGLSYQQVVEYLFDGVDLIKFKKFRKPKYFDETLQVKNFPVIGQENVSGFRFLAYIKDGKYTVYRSDNTELSAKFGILRKMAKFLPSDLHIAIDFVLQPKENSSMLLLEKRLNSNESIKNANMIILDMYYNGDTATTKKRMKRIQKFVNKCRSIKLNSICAVPYKIINDQESLDSFCQRMLAKRGAVIIKTNGSYRSNYYKAEKQFSNESMLIEDYTVKHQTRFNKREMVIDTVTCITNTGETVYIKNWVKTLDNKIPNLVGKYVKVKWQENSSGMYPFIYGMNRYKLIENSI